MGDFANKPVEITAGTPKDVAGLRKDLIGYVGQNFGKGATQYGGNLNAGVDPLTQRSNSILSALMGGGAWNQAQPTGAVVGGVRGPGGVGSPSTGGAVGSGSGTGKAISGGGWTMPGNPLTYRGGLTYEQMLQYAMQDPSGHFRFPGVRSGRGGTPTEYGG